VQQLADRGSPLWAIFSPLAVDATAGSMIEVLRALRGRIDEERSLRLGPAQRARIERESHEDVLMQWFRRALLAQRTAELFVASA
jgi:hypothetical protein